jgi:hypothetical protein
VEDRRPLRGVHLERVVARGRGRRGRPSSCRGRTPE